MKNNFTKDQNIYKLARNEKGMTIDQAAEELFISGRMLAYYECLKIIPGDDMVVKMVELYYAEWLAFAHMKKSSIVKMVLPGVSNITNFAHVVLMLDKEINDVVNLQKRLREIAYDNVVSEDELESYKEILRELAELAGVAMAITMGRWEKESEE